MAKKKYDPSKLADLVEEARFDIDDGFYAESVVMHAGYVKTQDGRQAQVQVKLTVDKDDWISDN